MTTTADSVQVASLPFIGALGKADAARLKAFFVKAGILLAALLAYAALAPTMPLVVAAIFWAALSAFSALGLAYHVVIRKARRRYGLKEGGLLSRVNSGRVFSLVVAFVVSALCVGPLLMELPKWEPATWALFVLAIPCYALLFLGAQRLLAQEYEPLLRVSRTVKASCAILCALLLLFYLLAHLTSTVEPFETMQEAFLAASKPFEHSPSVLLADLGYLVALVDSVSAYGVSQLAESSAAAYMAWRVALVASSVLAVSNLIGTCSLRETELKLGFLPLDFARNDAAGAAVEQDAAAGEQAGEGALSSASADSDSDAALRKATPVRRYVLVACALPLALVVGCMAVEAQVQRVSQTQEYTAIKELVREQAGMAVCIIDGKPYDYNKVKELYGGAQELSAELAREREAALVPLVNQMFDQRLANVDAYLDWYYSLPADYERLAQLFTGTIEEGLRSHLADSIEAGVDDTAFNEQWDYFWEQSESLGQDIRQDLSRYELSDYGLDGSLEWLAVSREVLSPDYLSGALAPTQHFLDAGTRVGLGAAAGAVAGVVATKATQRILAKPFFSKIVSTLSLKLGARGLLAAGGTALAPVVGTAIGVGVGIAGDYLFVKADEALNREAYREEIVAAIEESRQEMLSVVQAS